MKRIKWRIYNDLAWTEIILCPPEDYIKEGELYCKAIKEHSKNELKTMLHLGSGAGILDYTFKNNFIITGVDISKGMLKAAKKINPDIRYIHGDMRSVKLPELYDIVIIPDSIGYIVTYENLRQVIFNACRHLKQVGMLLITAQLREEFQENNFVYSNSRDNMNITVFENNYLPDSGKEAYEAVFCYLIRRNGKLKIYNDHHLLGLFPLETWVGLLNDAGLEMVQIKVNNLYDNFIMNEGKYPQTLFICNKP